MHAPIKKVFTKPFPTCYSSSFSFSFFSICRSSCPWSSLEVLEKNNNRWIKHNHSFPLRHTNIVLLLLKVKLCSEKMGWQCTSTYKNQNVAFRWKILLKIEFWSSFQGSKMLTSLFFCFPNFELFRFIFALLYEPWVEALLNECGLFCILANGRGLTLGFEHLCSSTVGLERWRHMLNVLLLNLFNLAPAVLMSWLLYFLFLEPLDWGHKAWFLQMAFMKMIGQLLLLFNPSSNVLHPNIVFAKWVFYLVLVLWKAVPFRFR